MANGSTSALSATVQELIDITEQLDSKVSTLNINFFDNFNYITNNLSQLDKNIIKINNSFDDLNKFNNDSFKMFLTQKINSIERIFSELFVTNELPVSDDNLNNRIFFNLYDKTGSIILTKQKLNFSERINSLYSFPFNPIDLNLNVGTYSMSVYYENSNNIYEFSQADIIDSITSTDGNLQRFILDNQINQISDNLRNYKIYLISDGDSIKNKQTIISSTINAETQLDVVCFMLDKELQNNPNYTIVIKEELFDTVHIDLTIGEFDSNNVSNMILGNAERNLETGEFTVFDSLGNELGTMVSTRFGKKEYRRRIS